MRQISLKRNSKCLHTCNCRTLDIEIVSFIREIAHLQMHIEIECQLLFNLINMQRRTPTLPLPFYTSFRTYKLIYYLPFLVFT